MITSLVGRVPILRNFFGGSEAGPAEITARQFLLDLLPRDSVGAEIGVHQGDFSAALLMHVKPRELHLIDPWQHESADLYKDAWYGGKANAGQAEMDERYAQTSARFADALETGQVRIHRSFSHVVLAGFADGYFDWIYIDGNHLYDFVKQDLLLSLQKVRRGGLITGDDYTDGGWWDGGVKRAVDEFIEQMPVQRVAIENRQFVLRK